MPPLFLSQEQKTHSSSARCSWPVAFCPKKMCVILRAIQGLCHVNISLISRNSFFHFVHEPLSYLQSSTYIYILFCSYLQCSYKQRETLKYLMTFFAKVMSFSAFNKMVGRERRKARVEAFEARRGRREGG